MALKQRVLLQVHTFQRRMACWGCIVGLDLVYIWLCHQVIANYIHNDWSLTHWFHCVSVNGSCLLACKWPPQVQRLEAETQKQSLSLFRFYYYQKPFLVCIFGILPQKDPNFLRKGLTLEEGGLFSLHLESSKLITIFQEYPKTQKRFLFGHVFIIFFLGFSLKVSIATWLPIFSWKFQSSFLQSWVEQSGGGGGCVMGMNSYLRCVSLTFSCSVTEDVCSWLDGSLPSGLWHVW